MNYNIYERLDYLRELLKSDGYNTFSDTFDDAVAFGSTSTEILMRVRYLLVQFQQNSSAQVSEETRNLVEEILRYINKTLS